MIHVGTSGFSYQDWVGKVYPAGTKKHDYLAHYAGRFRALEVNYTYYAMPGARTMESLVDKSDGQVRFSVKLNRCFTHERTAGRAEASAFGEAVAPMAQSGTLGCLLAQFPYSFKCTRGHLHYLERLRGWFPGHPLVVEVRNARWVHPGFFEFLTEQEMGFCCVDEPDLPGLLPPLEEVTSPVGYLRFHGRNKAKWWQHDRPEERYDYLYPSEELREWLPRLRRMEASSNELFVFFNNHFEGKAATNAAQLLRMLQEL